MVSWLCGGDCAPVSAQHSPPQCARQVNKENFLAVIAGDEEAVKGKGTGKVLKATAEDRVFLFYSDHGSIGMLCFPDQRFLYADELVHALQDRY